MTDDLRLAPEDWVDVHGDFMFRYAYSRLRDQAAAEEVVQDAFVAGIENHQQFAGRGSERGWLTAILKRKIVDYIRLRNRFTNSEPEDNDQTLGEFFDESGRWRDVSAAGSLWPDRLLESAELRDVVQKCLATLPKAQADVFVLSVMEEMTSAEICRELDISQANFWVRMHRARLKLANCVGARWFATEEKPTHAK